MGCEGRAGSAGGGAEGRCVRSEGRRVRAEGRCVRFEGDAP